MKHEHLGCPCLPRAGRTAIAPCGGVVVVLLLFQDVEMHTWFGGPWMVVHRPTWTVAVQCESAQVLEEDAASEEEEGKVAQAVLKQARSNGSAREAIDPAYTQLFLLKYVCSHPGCYGTMVPQSLGSDVHVCNVCSKARTDAQFIAELEAELA